MREWFDLLLEKGPIYGYFPKPSKCILVAKPDRLEQALKVFKGSSVEVKIEGSKDTGIEIITEGTRHLGAAVGTTEFRNSYVQKKVDNWVSVKRSRPLNLMLLIPHLRSACKANGPLCVGLCLWR